ncbi:MAG: SPASM domain-containing protein [Deltaproteobacteria bacterium]|nr:SPASM domain-containing protein [Deltaproteobacteria bacterium]
MKRKISMGVMEKGFFEKIVDDFSDLSKRNGFRGSVLFCNMGELFIYPEVIDRIEYVLNSGLDFNVQTNGFLMSPGMVDSLLQCGFKGTILISCHGITPGVYKEVMGLDISTTLRNVDYLIRHYPRNRIGIQAIPHDWPRGEARRVRKYWSRKGISVRMPLPISRAGLVPSIRTRYRSSLTGRNPDRPLGEMVICFNGDVILCCNDMAQQEGVGNLRKNNIEEVWNGETFLDKLEQIYCGKASGDDFICKMCEFARFSNSQVSRLLKNIKYSVKRFFLTHVW